MDEAKRRKAAYELLAPRQRLGERMNFHDDAGDRLIACLEDHNIPRPCASTSRRLPEPQGGGSKVA